MQDVTTIEDECQTSETFAPLQTSFIIRHLNLPARFTASTDVIISGSLPPNQKKARLRMLLAANWLKTDVCLTLGSPQCHERTWCSGDDLLCDEGACPDGLRIYMIKSGLASASTAIAA